MEDVTLTAEDGYELSLSVYPLKKARGCVQIVHGMEEHKGRYDSFAKKLNEAGFSVVVSDMRGHGSGAPILGFFGEKDGDKYLLSDQKRITKYIKARFDVEKVYLFAHSMGTIIVRNLLQTQSKQYEKVVLSGSPYDPGHLASGMALFLCAVMILIHGPKYDSQIIAKLATGSFNKAIPNPKTQFDWISRSEENIRAYQEDPYCGKGFKVAAYRDLFRLIWNMSRTKRFRAVNVRLPIFLIRGDEDPCTGFAKGAAASVATLRKAGFQNIRTKAYANMRHEVLNEDGKEQVIADVVAFLK